MALYNLYAGVDSGNYQYTKDFDSAAAAEDEAFELACDEYENSDNVTTFDECYKHISVMYSNFPQEVIHNMALEYYEDIKENSITSYAILTSEDSLDFSELEMF